MSIRETKIRYRNALSAVLIDHGAKIVRIQKGADIDDRQQEKFQERLLKRMATSAFNEVHEEPTIDKHTRSRVKKALKAVSGRRPTKVVNGTRFIDPKTKMVYAAGSKSRGKWLSTGVKNTHLVGEYTERVILGNLTPFQPKRAR